MTDRQLTDFEHILLGMICAAPSTGYQLKQKFTVTPISIYQPSSGALYPALRRLERNGLLVTRPPARSSHPTGRTRYVYEPTQTGRAVHRQWVRSPVDPATIARDLGLHLLRFVMMESLLSEREVVTFLHSLREALRAFIVELERYTAATNFGDRHSPLALDHGIAIHRASLQWANRAIAELSVVPSTPARRSLRSQRTAPGTSAREV